MPELPEVETARRGVAEQFVGRRVTGHDLRLPKLVVAPEGLTLDALSGQRLVGVARHGKYLTFYCGDISAVTHLMLSGQLAGRGDRIPGFTAGHPVPRYGALLPHKSTHLVLNFDHGGQLFLTDMRHFARVRLFPTESLPAYFASLRLGPDAIGPAFTAAWLRRALRARKAARLKPLLLDQTFVAGLGNIYVDESLHRAGLHPERSAHELSAAEAKRLYDAIVDVLAIAIPLGGASIVNGKATPQHGQFPFVHGREGLPCLNCGAQLAKIRVDQRGTYTCPICQPEPPRG